MKTDTAGVRERACGCFLAISGSSGEEFVNLGADTPSVSARAILKPSPRQIPIKTTAATPSPIIRPSRCGGGTRDAEVMGRGGSVLGKSGCPGASCCLAKWQNASGVPFACRMLLTGRSGLRKSPPHRLAKMVEVLNLSGRKRAVFLMLACLAHAPKELSGLLQGLAEERNLWTPYLLTAMQKACRERSVTTSNPPRLARYRRPKRRHR